MIDTLTYLSKTWVPYEHIEIMSTVATQKAVKDTYESCYDIVSKYRSSSMYLSQACDDLEKLDLTQFTKPNN